MWEQAAFDLLLSEGKITEEVVAYIRIWRHSGFSVDQSVRIETEDSDGLQKLVEYFLRCPFSQARMIEVTSEGQVLYKTEHNRMARFPEAASEDLLAGPKRNFQVFDPLDFLAEVTQHIPDAGDHVIRYYARGLAESAMQARIERKKIRHFLMTSMTNEEPDTRWKGTGAWLPQR